jgi:hypothetical protein
MSGTQHLCCFLGLQLHAGANVRSSLGLSDCEEVPPLPRKLELWICCIARAAR